MTYKLTAVTHDLKYRLGGLPSKTEGVVIKKGDSINIVAEGLRLIKLVDAVSLKPASNKQYTLTPLS